jgi:signal transduction histidine kinase
VSIGISKTQELQGWRHEVLVYGFVAFAGAVMLLSISWYAMSRMNREMQRRLLTERELHSARRMEEVGRLTAGVAHYFNNMLATMLGSLELLMHPTDRAQQLAERAYRAGERGSQIIAALLAFAGKQALRMETVALNKLLMTLLPLAEESIGATNSAVKINMMLDPGLRDCRADPEHLKGALLNLIVNAYEAMPDGGTLTITTRNDDVNGSTNVRLGSYVCVAIGDTGDGMTDEVKSRIFEPFFTTKERHEGAGLGLSQVLGYVQQTDGDLTLDTKPGEGTTVTLYLPAIE